MAISERGQDSKHSLDTNLEVLGNLTNKPLEGQLTNQEFRRLLVPTDFTKGDSTRSKAMGLLDTTGRGLYVC